MQTATIHRTTAFMANQNRYAIAAGLFMRTRGPYEHSNEQYKSTLGEAPIGSKNPKSGTHVSFGWLGPEKSGQSRILYPWTTPSENRPTGPYFFSDAKRKRALAFEKPTNPEAQLPFKTGNWIPDTPWSGPHSQGPDFLCPFVSKNRPADPMIHG